MVEVKQNNEGKLITEYEGVEYKLIPVNRKMPSFINENEDGTFTVTAKGKEYILKELSGSQVDNARKLAGSMNKPEESVIAMKSLVSPELDESEFFDLPGSIYMKLTGAIQYIYELTDFLE